MTSLPSQSLSQQPNAEHELGSVTTIEDELARLDQALVDLHHSGGVSVSLVRCPSRARERTLTRKYRQLASERGFVTVERSLLEFSFDTLDQLVAELLENLSPPAELRARGFLELLERHAEKYGRRSLDRFEQAAAEFGAEGDLTALSRAFLTAEDEARREVRAYEAWLNGVELRRKVKNAHVHTALNQHTAQRALSELTRIVRALGHAGTLICLHEADALARRTSRQRDKAYTVLRELVDNFDSGRGAVATRIVLTGLEPLFEGPRSIRSLTPLLMRLEVPSNAEPPPPHRAWTSLISDPLEYVHRRITRKPDNKPATLRTLIRISQGLPPIEAVSSMSVGHERIDRTIDKLFLHSEMSGSVFSLLVGDYGSGKTHVLLHLAERAFKEYHPVFWLNLERMNLDLGSPPRHYARLLEHSVLPMRLRPSAAERAVRWARSKTKFRRLLDELTELAETDTEEAPAAQHALSIAEQSKQPALALESFLLGRDLAKRGASKSYRLASYRRLLLLLELLKRLEGCGGPVLLIDEAENLFAPGASRTARRTALRSLSFYCGGGLPGACIVMAMTPPALVQLRRESRELFHELNEQSSTLAWEDVVMFRRRLQHLEPQYVPPFSRTQRLELAEKVRATHRSVRGHVEIEDWDRRVRELARNPSPPRVLIRSLIDQLESAWWAGG